LIAIQLFFENREFDFIVFKNLLPLEMESSYYIYVFWRLSQ